jgi:branched-chain amino acid transport system permease protein
MQELSLVLVRGIGLGSVYSLVAMSLNVTYNSSSILNFAQGDWLVMGALFALLLGAGGMSAIVWISVAIFVGLLVALAMTIQGELTLLPLKSSVAQHSWLVTTLAASAIIESLILIWEGPQVIIVRSIVGNFSFLGVTHSVVYPLFLLLAVAVFFGLKLFQSRTLTGLAMNALRQDLEAARSAGLWVRRLQLFSFALSGLIVGLTGFLGAPILGLAQASGSTIAFGGFVALVIGGMGSQSGALMGGPVLGVLTQLTILVVGSQFQDAVPLVLLVLVLLVKPEGVFAHATARRV